MPLQYFSTLPTPWLTAFCVLCHWSYKSKLIPRKPSYTSDDVTVVIPTIHDNFDEFRLSLESILATQPHELIMVTTADKLGDLQRVTKNFSNSKNSTIRIFCTQYANKRIQVCEALPKITTRITIMADDDVTWPSTIMPWILAPFEDPGIGGVGTCQRVKRVREGGLALRVWNWLGAAYIERRNFEISATHNIDGGTSCMSGRTGAYRSEILQDYEFLEGFMKEEWWGKILKADDDNFVTRWLVNHQWKTWIQYERECEVETTLENNFKFLYQCSRWARSNWRSNWTSLVKERCVWKQQRWCTYALHFATFTSLAFVFDFLILASLWWGTEDWNPINRTRALYTQLIFLAFSKVVKLVGLFRRHPADVVFLPVSVVFGYFHGLVKIYAGLTLNNTSWGSRTNGNTNDSHTRPTP
ncbi:Type 2 glycosyltransferase [Pyricularia oryzae]|nr:Type 2 glycosyltransferase [Pyricularia oryzae]